MTMYRATMNGPVELTPEEEAAVLAEWEANENAPPPRRLIAKSVVQERAQAKGKLDEVFTVLQSQPIYFARWFAPDWPNVYADDEGLLMILAGAGCSEAEIAEITAP